MSSGAPQPSTPAADLRADAVLFVLFVLICLGLGYATLARWDPREVGNLDARHYHAMVEGTEVPHPNAEVFRARILVPGLARAFRPLLEGRVGTWSSTALALLVVNSLFVAGTASVLVVVARRATRRRDVLRARALPRPWRAAALVGVGGSVVLAAWAHGSAERLAFDVAGPLLSLGVALTVLDAAAPAPGDEPTSSP